MKQRSSLQLQTAAVSLPVSLNEVKNYLSIGDDDETADARIMGKIRAVTNAVERHLRRSLINTTWTLFMDRFPGKPLPWWDGTKEGADTELVDLTEPIFLPMAPLSSVTYVKSHLSDGTETTFAAANYLVDTAREPGRLGLKISQSWPSNTLRGLNGVEVEFVGGYGATGTDVPEAIRHAILEWLYDADFNPGGTGVKFERVGESAVSYFDPSAIPGRVSALLATYKIWQL